MKFYEKDLAKIHDIAFCDFINIVSKELLKILKRYDIKKGHVIDDLGCGSGTLAEILSNNGFSVTGVDIWLQLHKRV